MSNQEIRCNVHSCKYNDKTHYCTLDSIVVGSETSDARNKSETECVSFAQGE